MVCLPDDEGVGVFQCPVCRMTYSGKISSGTSYHCGGSGEQRHRPVAVKKVPKEESC